MHFSGGGGGGHSGGGGHGHSGHSGGESFIHSPHGHSGHHGEGNKDSLKNILGGGGSHAGGGIMGALAHMLGLGGHHMMHHQGGAGGAPDQNPSWSMAWQWFKDPWAHLLGARVRWTPALGFWLLFVFLGCWLGVVYHLRHTEPAENFAQLSNQLYTRQLPTARPNGQVLPMFKVNDPSAMAYQQTASQGQFGVSSNYSNNQSYGQPNPQSYAQFYAPAQMQTRQQFVPQQPMIGQPNMGAGASYAATPSAFGLPQPTQASQQPNYGVGYGVSPRMRVLINR